MSRGKVMPTRKELQARLKEADRCLKILGVTWSGSSYIGMAPEPSYEELQDRIAELEAEVTELKKHDYREMVKRLNAFEQGHGL